MLNLLKETEKFGCRLMTTPIEENNKMAIKYGSKFNEEAKRQYSRLVGKLIYVTLIRSESSDIIYAINVVSLFIHSFTDVHLHVV